MQTESVSEDLGCIFLFTGSVQWLETHKQAKFIIINSNLNIFSNSFTFTPVHNIEMTEWQFHLTKYNNYIFNKIKIANPIFPITM